MVAVSPGAGKPYLKPTAEAVRKGEYPIHRPLLRYSRGRPRGELRKFLAYVLGEDGRRIVAAHDFTTTDVSELPADTDEPQASSPARRARVYRVRFAFGSAALGPEAMTTLHAVRAGMAGAGARLLVVGNADTAGDPEVNRRMARIRAERVAQRLVRMGIHPEDIAVDVHGSDTPLASNATAAGRRENRRVDVEVVPRK